MGALQPANTSTFPLHVGPCGAHQRTHPSSSACMARCH